LGGDKNMLQNNVNILRSQKRLLFGWKLGFRRILDSLYGAIWRCSRVWQ